MLRTICGSAPIFCFCLGLPISQAQTGPAVSVSLRASEASPQPIGTTINWTASASSTGSGPLWYRFSVTDSSGFSYIAKDYSLDRAFAWTPSEYEDTFHIGVAALDVTSGVVAHADVKYAIISHATGTSAVVSETGNPLVALYSAPPCDVGSSMYVRFQQAGSAISSITSAKPCTGKSMNFYIAGMYPNSTYNMDHEIVTGSELASAPELSFNTGTSTCQVNGFYRNLQALVPGSLSQSIILWSPVQNGGEPVATDLGGNLLWCFPQNTGYLTNPIAGGKLFILFTDGFDLSKNLLTIVDLAGNIVQETNVPCMNRQLEAAGFADITQFHHDARLLANGDILALGASERILTDVQGPGDIDVIGDVILVLDSNLQLKWAWDSFAHLDTTRTAVLGETCLPGGQEGCPPVLLSTIANDWTHGNAVSLAPDGNIIYSSRHQDFVYKIDYENGAGTGDVMWRLGEGGDFTSDSPDIYPWNSHQHDATFQSNGLLSLFDNGNTRVSLYGPTQQSRGQVLQIDEAAHRVHYLLNQPLGVYSAALGAAQLLMNGDYHFDCGAIVNGTSAAQVVDYTPGGTRVFAAQASLAVYRSFQMKTLYDVGNPQEAPNYDPVNAANPAVRSSSANSNPQSAQPSTGDPSVPAATSTAAVAVVPTATSAAPLVISPFTITAGTNNVTIVQNGSATVDLAVRMKAGFNANVAFTASILPADGGITVSFSPASLDVAGSAVTVISVDGTVAPGNYTVSVGANGSASAASSQISVHVIASEQKSAAALGN